VRRIPAGTGFDGARTAVPERSARLPAPDSYVLLVATIEARKNHALLVRVWRRLIEQMPADQVPRLVFAGSVGWLVGDLLQQLDNANWLDGHVALVHEPSDAELAALYRDCLFTVFPSLYEGWGLPVTESLGFGKPCIIANATALPEAGGAFARGFDPENVAEATAVIRQVLDDRAGLAAWEARVRAEFRPVPWTAAAGAIAEAVGLGVGAQGAARHADSVAPDARDLAWDTDGFSSGAERFSPGPKS
jgi:glycosyltransferase involved in cell wall biosynthesis